MAKLLFPVPAYTADWAIEINVANPKRPGTKCFYRFAILASCSNVAEAAKALGKGYRLEIAWCAARGFINLVDPADAARYAAEYAADAAEVAAKYAAEVAADAAEYEAELAAYAAEPESAAEAEPAAEAEVAAEAEAEIPAFLSKKARRAAKAAAAGGPTAFLTVAADCSPACRSPARRAARAAYGAGAPYGAGVISPSTISDGSGCGITILSPGAILFGSVIDGLAARMSSTVRPYAAAIPDSESPDFTV